MFCPQCGSEIVKNSIYCNNCGAKIIESSILSEDNINNEKLSKTLDSNKKKETNWFGRRNIISKIIIIYLLISIVYGCFSSSNLFDISSELKNTDVIYSQSVEHMVLSLGDMPDGWSGKINEWYDDYITSSFAYVGGIFPETVACKVIKYNTINESKEEYVKHRLEYKNTKLKEVDIGNEGFELNQMSFTKIVFRKGNVVVVLSGVYSNIEKFAKIVDKKIDRTKDYSTQTLSIETPRVLITETNTPTPDKSNKEAQDEISTTIAETIVTGSTYQLEINKPYYIKNSDYALKIVDINGNKNEAIVELSKFDKTIELTIISYTSQLSIDDIYVIELINITDDYVELSLN